MAKAKSKFILGDRVVVDPDGESRSKPIKGTVVPWPSAESDDGNRVYSEAAEEGEPTVVVRLDGMYDLPEEWAERLVELAEPEPGDRVRLNMDEGGTFHNVTGTVTLVKTDIVHVDPDWRPPGTAFDRDWKFRPRNADGTQRVVPIAPPHKNEDREVLLVEGEVLDPGAKIEIRGQAARVVGYEPAQEGRWVYVVKFCDDHPETYGADESKRARGAYRFSGRSWINLREDDGADAADEPDEWWIPVRLEDLEVGDVFRQVGRTGTYGGPLTVYETRPRMVLAQTEKGMKGGWEFSAHKDHKFEIRADGNEREEVLEEVEEDPMGVLLEDLFKTDPGDRVRSGMWTGDPIWGNTLVVVEVEITNPFTGEGRLHVWALDPDTSQPVKDSAAKPLVGVVKVPKDEVLLVYKRVKTPEEEEAEQREAEEFERSMFLLELGIG